MKVLLTVAAIGLIAGLLMVYWIFNKPHSDVAKEKGIAISAQQVYDAFRTNEA